MILSILSNPRQQCMDVLLPLNIRLHDEVLSLGYNDWHLWSSYCEHCDLAKLLSPICTDFDCLVGDSDPSIPVDSHNTEALKSFVLFWISTGWLHQWLNQHITSEWHTPKHRQNFYYYYYNYYYCCCWISMHLIQLPSALYWTEWKIKWGFLAQD